MRLQVRAGAQLYYLPTRSEELARQGLGIAPGPGIWHAQLTTKHVEALGVLFGGLFSASSLLLFALKRDRAGYMLGVAGALTAAILGAMRVFGQPNGDGA